MQKKSINKKAKGDRIEREYIKHSGFSDYFKPVRTKFSQKDILGAWDILLYDKNTRTLKFVQVKSNRKEITQSLLQHLLNFVPVNILEFSIAYKDRNTKKFNEIILARYACYHIGRNTKTARKMLIQLKKSLVSSIRELERMYRDNSKQREISECSVPVSNSNS